jgi:hypothetical protein
MFANEARATKRASSRSLSSPSFFSCLEQSPWLASSVLEVAFQMAPLDLLGQKSRSIEWHTARVTPSGPENELLGHVAIHDFPVNGSSRLERHRPPGLAHVLTCVQFIVAADCTRTRIVLLQVHIVVVRDDCFANFVINSAIVLLHELCQTDLPSPLMPPNIRVRGTRRSWAGSSASPAVCLRFCAVSAYCFFQEQPVTEFREIANDWAERGYINAKHLLMLEKAGMRDVTKIPPRWAPSKRDAGSETTRGIFWRWN